MIALSIQIMIALSEQMLSEFWCDIFATDGGNAADSAEVWDMNVRAGAGQLIDGKS
jgi:hypothetical protein